MGSFDFTQARDKLAVIEDAKSDKRQEIKNRYNSLIKHEEILDFLMLQIGKDIEQKFPGVEFRLISRIKTEASLSDKLENDLATLKDKKKIDEVDIYDIIALSIIIENVPDDIKTSDESFNDHMADLIQMRNETKGNIRMHEKQIEGYQKRIDILKAREKEKKEHKKENDEMIKLMSQDGENKNGIVDYLERIGESLQSAVIEIGGQIKGLGEDIESMKLTLQRTNDRYEKENNECNHSLADFIVKNLAKFEDLKSLGIAEIPKRFKQKENYDGYRATHNCFEMNVKTQNENGDEEEIKYKFELQGKSIDAFYIADRGKAAKYHTNQKEEPGKIVKRKRLPNILNAKTKKEKDDLKTEVEKTVPQYRIYRHVKNKVGVDSIQNVPDVYKLSQKECFVIYYSNQLFGNKTLEIKPNEDVLDDVIKTNILSGKGRKYKNYKYEDVEER